MTEDPTPVEPKRKPISQSLRYEVMRRDGFTCRYCGGKAPDAILTIDHIIPVTLGGTDDPSNLTTACKDCNAGKGSTPPDAQTVADIDAQALQYRSAMSRAADLIREQRAIADQFTNRFMEAWDSWGTGTGENRSSVYRPAASWRQTIINYVERGLPAEALFDNIVIAMKGPALLGDKWRYFCGVCKHAVEEITELAIKMMAEEQRAVTEATDEYSMDWIAEVVQFGRVDLEPGWEHDGS